MYVKSNWSFRDISVVVVRGFRRCDLHNLDRYTGCALVKEREAFALYAPRTFIQNVRIHEMGRVRCQSRHSYAKESHTARRISTIFAAPPRVDGMAAWWDWRE